MERYFLDWSHFTFYRGLFYAQDYFVVAQGVILFTEDHFFIAPLY